MPDTICPEFSLMWPLLVLFGGIAVVSLMIARQNGFTLRQTLAALTGTHKFAGSAAIYLTLLGTVVATVAVYFAVLPECVAA